MIDKDLAAALLATELGADALLILTDVPQAYVNYGTPEQQALSRVTASQMRAYAAGGHFKAGSMGPKVEACLRFVDAGGESVIASLTEVGPAMAGKAGTHIVPDAPASGARRRPAERRRPPRRPAAARRRWPQRPPPPRLRQGSHGVRARFRRGSHRHQHRPAASRRRVTARRAARRFA